VGILHRSGCPSCATESTTTRRNLWAGGGTAGRMPGPLVGRCHGAIAGMPPGQAVGRAKPGSQGHGSKGEVAAGEVRAMVLIQRGWLAVALVAPELAEDQH
jgi:hypothetical protein